MTISINHQIDDHFNIYIFSSISTASIFLVVKMEKWRIWDLYCSFLINYLSSAQKFLKLILLSHFLTLYKLCLIFRMFNQNERMWLVDWSVTYTIYHRLRQEMTDGNMRKRNSLWNTWYRTVYRLHEPSDSDSTNGRILEIDELGRIPSSRIRVSSNISSKN